MLPKLFAADSVLCHSSWPQCLDRTWKPPEWTLPLPPKASNLLTWKKRVSETLRVASVFVEVEPRKKNLRASTAHGRHNKYSSSLSDRFATISLLYTILKSRKFKLILCFSVENAVGLCYCCTKRTMEGENRKKFRSVLFDSLWRLCLISPWMNDVKMFSFAKQNS